MRVLIATDAWHPQVNGVVRTLTSLAASRAEPRRDDRISDTRRLSIDAAADLSGPAAGDCRAGARSRGASSARKPDAIHIATEGPIGFCRARLLPSGTACRSPRATRPAFPNTSAARVADPGSLELCGAAPLPRRRNGDDGVDAVADGGAARARLPAISACGPAASTPSCSAAIARSTLDLPRPIFLSVGRVAVEKNLEAFCRSICPASKVVIGEGPQEAELRQRFPDATVPRTARGHGARRALWRRPTCSCFRAGPTRSASCSSRRSPAACRSRPIPVTGPQDVDRRQPGRRARTTICAPPASAR